MIFGLLELNQESDYVIELHNFKNVSEIIGFLKAKGITTNKFYKKQFEYGITIYIWDTSGQVIYGNELENEIKKGLRDYGLVVIQLDEEYNLWLWEYEQLDDLPLMRKW